MCLRGIQAIAAAACDVIVFCFFFIYNLCRGPIYQGPMMAIPDKDLYFHKKCLVCVVCRSSVSMNYGRATVFLRHSLPHCTSCYSNDNGNG